MLSLNSDSWASAASAAPWLMASRPSCTAARWMVIRLLKKRAVELRRVFDAVQALAQLGQQAGNHLDQPPGAAARGRALLHAPDHVVDHGAVAVGIVRAIGAAELGLGHHLGPGIAQEVDHEVRDVQALDGLPELGGQLLRQQVALLGVQQRARRLLAALAARPRRDRPTSPAGGPSVRRTCRRPRPCCRASGPNPRPSPGSGASRRLLAAKARLRCVMRSRNWRAGWVRSLKKRESSCASLSTAGSMALSWRLNSGSSRWSCARLSNIRRTTSSPSWWPSAGWPASARPAAAPACPAGAAWARRLGPPARASGPARRPASCPAASPSTPGTV